MRLFVSLEVAASLRDQLSAMCRHVAHDLPPARWVPADRIHLTLVFLGEVEEENIESIGAAIRSVAQRHAPFELAIERPGVFPPRGRARVAWVGLAESVGLSSLQSDLEDALATSTSASGGSRPYHAHLTMARCKRPWPRWAAEFWCRADLPGVGQAFAVTYVDLMRSELTPSGPRYDRLQRFLLGG